MLLLHKKSIPLSQRKQEIAKSDEGNNRGSYDISGGRHFFLVTYYFTQERRTLSHALLHNSFHCQLDRKYLFRDSWNSYHQVNLAIQQKPVTYHRRRGNLGKPSSNPNKTGDSPQAKIDQSHVDHNRLLLLLFNLGDIIQCDPILF